MLAFLFNLRDLAAHARSLLDVDGLEAVDDTAAVGLPRAIVLVVISKLSEAAPRWRKVGTAAIGDPFLEGVA